MEAFEQQLGKVLDEIKELLLRGNAAYGDFALNPVRIFSRAAPTEGIRIRIDDKLSRLARGDSDGEDVVLDLLGYLVLLRMVSKPLWKDEARDVHDYADQLRKGEANTETTSEILVRAASVGFNVDANNESRQNCNKCGNIVFSSETLRRCFTILNGKPFIIEKPKLSVCSLYIPMNMMNALDMFSDPDTKERLL